MHKLKNYFFKDILYVTVSKCGEYIVEIFPHIPHFVDNLHTIRIMKFNAI